MSEKFNNRLMFNNSLTKFLLSKSLTYVVFVVKNNFNVVSYLNIKKIMTRCSVF